MNRRKKRRVRWTAGILLFSALFSILFSQLLYPSFYKHISFTSHLARPIVTQKISEKLNVDLKHLTPQISLFSPPKQVTLVVVGDIMLSRTVSDRIKKYDDPHYPFLKVDEFLRSADLTFGNLENPITEGPRIIPYQMQLRADPGIETTLKEVGFDVLSLANNHLPDFGVTGLTNTLQRLNQVRIAHAGAGENLKDARQPAYLQREGLRFAFLAYNDTDVVPDHYGAGLDHPGTAIMNLEHLSQDIQRAKKEADFVIVSMHSGQEYVQYPNASQTQFAHAAIEAGAELVIGHHPHVVQTMEKYQGKYIFYSLGNFIFDQMWSTETRQGLALKIYFDSSGVQNITFHPVKIEDYAQPFLLEGEEAEIILKRLEYDWRTLAPAP